MFNKLKRTQSQSLDGFEDDAVPSAQSQTLDETYTGSSSTVIGELGEGSFKRQKTTKEAVSQPKFFNDFDKTQGTFQMGFPHSFAEDKAMQLMNGKFNLCSTSALVQLGFNKLGPKANIGNYSFGEVAADKAKFSVNVVPGLPDKVANACPDEVARNKAWWKWVHDTCDGLLRACYKEKGYLDSIKKKKDADAKKEAKKAKKTLTDKDLEDNFVAKAENSLFRDVPVEKDSDDYVENVVLYRKYQYMNRDLGEAVSNRPNFWKPFTANSGQQKFKQLDVDYIPYGTVAKIKITFRFWVVGGRYGVALDLGPDIAIVWRPPKRQQAQAQMPIFDDDEE